MTLELYYFYGSPPCHSVRLLAKTLGIDMDMKFVDYFKAEHRSTEFTKMNPLQTVPTLNDNGFIVAESRAILGYLANKFGKDDSLYPKDLEKQTLVNQRLYFDLGTLYQSYREYYGPVFTIGKLGEPAKLAKVEDAFQILDTYLDGQNWAAGDTMTIADFSLVSSVACIEIIGDFDVSKYKNIARWYEKAKQLPGYKEIVQDGTVMLKEYYEQYKKK